MIRVKLNQGAMCGCMGRMSTALQRKSTAARKTGIGNLIYIHDFPLSTQYLIIFRIGIKLFRSLTPGPRSSVLNNIMNLVSAWFALGLRAASRSRGRFTPPIPHYYVTLFHRPFSPLLNRSTSSIRECEQAMNDTNLAFRLNSQRSTFARTHSLLVQKVKRCVVTTKLHDVLMLLKKPNQILLNLVIMDFLRS